MNTSTEAITVVLTVVRALALVLVLSTIGCGGSSSSPAQFTGLIAFSGYNGRLFTVDAATSSVTRIGRQTATGGGSWSPDAATIAYTTPDGVVVLADSSGTSERRLGRPPACLSPVFSPDGGRLACNYYEPNAIAVLDAGDGSVVMQTPDCCWEPAWSPGSRQIAYVSYGAFDPKSGRFAGGPPGVFVMNSDGTQKRRIAAKKPDYSVTPAWSSRGVIAFATDDGSIWTVNASGKGLRRLGPDDGRKTAGLTWSPDGTKLAFTHGDGDYEVFVMDADGAGLKNLTDNEKISDGSPSWSPDGVAIAFVSDRVEKLNQVFAMRADGSGQTQLTDDRRGSPRWNDIGWAAWSPTAG